MEWICILIVLIVVDCTVATDPYMVWPLGDQHNADEIARKSNSLSDANNYNLTFSGFHPDLRYAPIDLKSGYIDVTINEVGTFSGFTFFIYMNPRSVVDRMIFDYKSLTESNGINEVIVRLADSTSACVKVYASISGSQHIEQKCATFDPLPVNAWAGVWISYKSGKELRINLLGTNLDMITSLADTDLIFPGTIRFGGCFSCDKQPWDGLLTCALFYNTDISTLNEDVYKFCNVIEDQTKSETTQTSPIIPNDVTSTPLSRADVPSDGYTLVSLDSAIDPVITADLFLKERNIIRCASQCSKSADCLSFSYFFLECKIYNSTHTGSIVDAIGTKVFHRKFP